MLPCKRIMYSVTSYQEIIKITLMNRILLVLSWMGEETTLGMAQNTKRLIRHHPIIATRPEKSLTRYWINVNRLYFWIWVRLISGNFQTCASLRLERLTSFLPPVRYCTGAPPARPALPKPDKTPNIDGVLQPQSILQNPGLVVLPPMTPLLYKIL